MFLMTNSSRKPFLFGAVGYGAVRSGSVARFYMAKRFYTAKKSKPKKREAMPVPLKRRGPHIK